MKKYYMITSILFMFAASTTFADSTGFVSIPASAFSEQNSESSSGKDSYKGNDTGTSRYFNGNLFASINLPHDAIVSSLTCGSKPKNGYLTSFILRRNEPQQANVDMATIVTSKDSSNGAGLQTYQFLKTDSIISPTIDNSKFNYYIVASQRHPGFGASTAPAGMYCPDKCANVNFCNVGYTIVERDPGEGAGKTRIIR